MMDITTYDQHHSAPEREVITVETKIKSTNKGYSILTKLGWKAGQPLGLSGEGASLFTSINHIFLTTTQAELTLSHFLSRTMSLAWGSVPKMSE